MPAGAKLPLTEAGREQIKLRANFLNEIAIATFAVGTLGALSKALLEIPADRTVPVAGLAFATGCFSSAGSYISQRIDS